MIHRVNHRAETTCRFDGKLNSSLIDLKFLFYLCVAAKFDLVLSWDHCKYRKQKVRASLSIMEEKYLYRMHVVIIFGFHIHGQVYTYLLVATWTTRQNLKGHKYAQGSSVKSQRLGACKCHREIWLVKWTLHTILQQWYILSHTYCITVGPLITWELIIGASSACSADIQGCKLIEHS